MTTEPVEPQPTPKEEPTLRTSVPEPPDHGEVESQDPQSRLCGNHEFNKSKNSSYFQIHQVRLKYDPLFWRQPNVFGVGEGVFREEDGSVNYGSSKVGIIVHVTDIVDQNTLPMEDRIPDCLEGIPVQIRKGKPPSFLQDLIDRHTERNQSDDETQ